MKHPACLFIQINFDISRALFLTSVARRYISFLVECEEMRSSALLNSVPIDLAGRNLGGLEYQLLYFTRENADDVKAITARFLAAEKTDQPHTGGLYYRELL